MEIGRILKAEIHLRWGTRFKLAPRVKILAYKGLITTEKSFVDEENLTCHRHEGE